MKAKFTLLLLNICFVLLLQAQTNTQGDLTVTRVYNASHDYYRCWSEGTVAYNIHVANSSATDTVRIVLNQGGAGILWWQAANVTGAQSWDTTYIFQLGFRIDVFVQNDSILMDSTQLKVTCGPDTILIQHNYTLRVSNPCNYDTVSGRIYNDANHNCVYDAGDNGMNLKLSLLSEFDGGAYVMSGEVYNILPDGRYHDWVQLTHRFKYSIYIDPAYRFIFPGFCTPMRYNFTNLQSNANIDFAVGCNDFIDLQVWNACQPAVRPAMPFLLNMNAGNMGCTPTDGIIQLALPQGVTYNAALTDRPADSTSGNMLFWHFRDLSSVSNGFTWNSFVNRVYLLPDTNLTTTDTLCFAVSIPVLSNETDAQNNFKTICLPVRNSFDPNMKEVSPAGETAQGLIPQSTEWLTYTIHFQNTGNDLAYHVHVMDTLDPNVQDTTLQIIGASHTMQPSLVEPGVIKFNFDNINLADSMHNEPASHGSVSYRIKLKPGMQPGQQVRNTGAIYFDFNPPIFTNTTLNTIAAPTAIAPVIEAMGINIYPNPATGIIAVALQHPAENFTLRLLTVTGETVTTKTGLSGTIAALDLSKNPTGIYIVELISNGNTTRTKVVKQ